MLRMKRILLLLLLAAVPATVTAQKEASQDLGLDYGLRVVSYPSPRTDFTSLALDDGHGIPTFGRSITMSCEILNRPENIFGTIFRIITDKGDNIDLMYSISRTDKHYPILVTGEQVWEIPGEISLGKWIPVSISLNSASGDIHVNYNGAEFDLKDAGTKGARSLHISFGFCPFEGFGLDDVASIDIRNVKLEREGKTIRYWKLSLHDDQKCYDEIHHSTASGANTKWLIDKHITWVPIFHRDFPAEISVAFDPSGVFYLSCNGRDISTFDARDHSSDEITVDSGSWPVNCPGGMLYLDGDGSLISYNVDEDIVSSLSGRSGGWTGGRASSGDSNYWNKTSSLDTAGRRIYSFGGYGHYNFKNDLIVQEMESGKGINTQIVDITPRYCSASVIVDSLMYVFGGRGNPSGKQELNPKYYYDLYSIDIHTLDVRKIWEDNGMADNGHFLPGENLLYEKSGDMFYSMTNLQGGTLVRFGRTVPGMELMSLPIEDYGHAQFSYYNLYINRNKDKIYSSKIKSQVDGSSTVSIYEMDYPAIPVSLLMQSAEKDGTKVDPARVVIAALLSIIAMLALWFILYSRRSKSKSAAALQPYEPDRTYYDFSRSSICLLGGFCVKDKDGADITSQFTPTLKYLTVLLILFSAKDPNGIISNRLNHLLWSYKSEDSANNNRNVHISKLRGILSQVGDITVCNHNRFWSISFGEGSSCDYMEAMRMFGGKAAATGINPMLELIFRGMLLPNIELDWVDGFKSDFSNRAIDFLMGQIKRTDLPDDVVLRIADTIFQHDFLNLQALRYKCRTLSRQGKSGLAKSTYDTFRKEYRDSMGEDFPHSFKDITG